MNLTIIAGFNKVKGLVPDMDTSVIADALRHSNILEVSEDGKSVRKPGTVKKVVSLGGMDFSSRDEVVTYARGLIAEGDAAEDGAISAEGQTFVTDVLKLLPRNPAGSHGIPQNPARSRGIPRNLTCLPEPRAGRRVGG